MTGVSTINVTKPPLKGGFDINDTYRKTILYMGFLIRAKMIGVRLFDTYYLVTYSIYLFEKIYGK